jgi:hypothetical protein
MAKPLEVELARSMHRPREPRHDAVDDTTNTLWSDLVKLFPYVILRDV